MYVCQQVLNLKILTLYNYKIANSFIRTFHKISDSHILSFKFGKLNVWFPVPIKVKLKMLGLKCSKYIPGHYKTFNFGKFIF